MLYVEGTSFASDVEELLRERSAEPDTKVTSGTAWPAPSSFHVPATPENLRAFHELALRHAEPEVCTHLVAYRAGQVLVSAYDAGDGTVFVHVGLGPSTIDRLRDAAS